MKIDLIHYSAPPIVGGVESVLAHHARLMSEAGHQVRVLAGRGEAIGERIPIVRLPLADSRHASILKIKRELDQGRVPEGFEAVRDELFDALSDATRETDFVIAHNVCSLHKNLPLTSALFELSQEAQAPHLILWHHDLAWTTSRYRSELHDGFPWDLLRRHWTGTTQVVVSELRKTELSALLGISTESITVVPNGLDLRKFLKLENQTEELVSKLNLLSASPILLLPVRITPRKNIELALRIVASLRQQYSDMALIITGPMGPHNPANVHYFERLRALRDELGLGSTVHFLAEYSEEYLPDGVIFDFYRIADALLMPSREEGFGIPIIEAGMAGLPVFCTDIPPLRALAGKHALYFSPDADPEQVAERIGEVLSNTATHQLRVRVRTQYTWEQIYSDRIRPLFRMTGRGK